MTSNNSFLKDRISSLQNTLQEGTALLIEDPIDLYYLTGLSFSLGELWIVQKEACLFVDGRYIQSAQKAPCQALLTSCKEISSFLQKNSCKKALFDGTKATFERVQNLQKLYPTMEWSSSPCVTKDLRMIKHPLEIQKLQKSADLLWEGFLYIQTLLKEGVLEKEIACKFTTFCLEKGADGLSFDPIIAFGENSAMPHYRAGNRALKQGDAVLIDIGVLCDHYHSDMTRVLFFGEKNPTLAKWFDIVVEAHDAALKLCKPGLHFKELDLAARKVFKDHKVEEYFVHSLGHGVGLEIHEFPKIRFDSHDKDLILKPGMVFTVEPGLYLPGTGGIRHENTIYITENGYTSFTTCQ